MSTEYRVAVRRLTAASRAWQDWTDAVVRDDAPDDGFAAIKAEYEEAFAALGTLLDGARS